MTENNTMKTTPQHRRALAAEIRAHIATSPATPPWNNRWGGCLTHPTDVHLKLGPMSIRLRNHPDNLEAVARRIESGHGGCATKDYHSTPAKPDILKMDAVRHCGTPEAALATIRRQLAIQGQDMHPADLKRCERAASLIEAHLAAEKLVAEQEAAEEALEARITAGRVPDNREITPLGTEVAFNHEYRRYIGTVETCEIGPHPILGKQHPSAVYAIRATHLKETKGKRYAFHPIRPVTLKRIIALDVKILP